MDRVALPKRHLRSFRKSVLEQDGQGGGRLFSVKAGVIDPAIIGWLSAVEKREIPYIPLQPLLEIAKIEQHRSFLEDSILK